MYPKGSDSMTNIQYYDEHAKEYDHWYDSHKYAYETEVNAITKLMPKFNEGLEIGVGTGRFATRFGIKTGVEPSTGMASLAKERGITIHIAKAEKLPLSDGSFDLVLIVTVLGFLEEPIKALEESYRVLKPGGHIVIGEVDKNSFLGRYYESENKGSGSYQSIKFYTVDQFTEWLQKAGFSDIKMCQTFYHIPEEITEIKEIKDGYGEGGFVVISARK